MNSVRKSLNLPFRYFNSSSISFFSTSTCYQSDVSSEVSKAQPNEVELSIEKKTEFTPKLDRKLEFLNKYVKPREVWIENFDSIKEEKRGLIQLHPKIFGTIPRLDLIHSNVKWQELYNKVVLYSVKNRVELKGGGRKPRPQKGTGRARLGSIRAPQVKGGGICHGPRNPTSYFYVLPYHLRIHGLTSTLSAKFAQDDIHVVDNLHIPSEDPQYIMDLIKERHWGISVLIVDTEDIMPKNITIATDTIPNVNLMPSYGLNVFSMLKHETLVLTTRAVEDIENKLLKILNSANPFELAKKYDFQYK